MHDFCLHPSQHSRRCARFSFLFLQVLNLFVCFLHRPLPFHLSKPLACMCCFAVMSLLEPQEQRGLKGLKVSEAMDCTKTSAGRKAHEVGFFPISLRNQHRSQLTKEGLVVSLSA